MAKRTQTRRASAPNLPYQPLDPARYSPNIGLIACGGITAAHLTAYRKAGYKVVAMCDLIEQRMLDRRKRFYPKADVYRDYHDLLARDDIEVVDVATHPEDREPILEDALRAGKHVLSQKPFVLDLDFGRRLVRLADRRGVRLAVNQNGRWAPHFSYLRQAIAAGLIGDVTAVHTSVHWDHNWVKGKPFDRVRHVILYDFAIHWFDILCCFMGGRKARSVYATFTKSPTQQARQRLLAQAMVQYPGAQASLVFDADTHFGHQDRTFIVGTKGTIQSVDSTSGRQKVTLFTAKGHASPRLVGKWFPDGFHGTMGELLRAVESGREPYNSARNNLDSLALCFAAVASAEQGTPVRPGTVKKLEPAWR
ncbi:MAG TPA: Gfo/Idh/MocA family oxidoreductase [Phycisphaerae bacterium]|nr:Gfo/Idh/MocA family oxidoreductase [Phycisphaerae bacterium]